MKKTLIAYVVYLCLVVGSCALCFNEILDKNVVMIVDVVLIAIVFLFCANIFYVPRNMDHGVLLENKQKMKNDPILWKEMLFLEIPLLVSVLALFFL